MLLLTCALALRGQSFQPISIQYALLPASKVQQSDESVYDQVEKGAVQVLDISLRYPVRMHRVLLIPELSYKNYHQEVSGWPSDQNSPGNGQMLGVSASTIIPAGQKLAFTTSMGMSGGFQEGVPMMDSQKLFRINAGFVVAIDSLTRLGLSVAYSKVLNVPFPVLVFQHTFARDGARISLAFPFRGSIEFPIGDRTTIELKEHLMAGRFSVNDPSQTYSSYNCTQVALTAGLSRRLAGPLYVSVAGGLVMIDAMKLFDEDSQKVDRLVYDRLNPMCTASVYIKVGRKNNGRLSSEAAVSLK